MSLLRLSGFNFRFWKLTWCAAVFFRTNTSVRRNNRVLGVGCFRSQKLCWSASVVPLVPVDLSIVWALSMSLRELLVHIVLEVRDCPWTAFVLLCTERFSLSHRRKCVVTSNFLHWNIPCSSQIPRQRETFQLDVRSSLFLFSWERQFSCESFGCLDWHWGFFGPFPCFLISCKNLDRT